VTNNWKCKVGINELTVGGDESSKEREETNHHKPVRKTNNSEIKHLGVTKDFAKCHAKTCALVVAACGICCTLFIDR
jgi:hypothetical protein